MAVRDYSGFQAIVTSVEKLRETVTIEADKQLSVFRAIRDTQNSQLKVLERMVEGLRTRSQTRNNFGFPDRLELKNVRLQAGTVTLTARSVIVETKGGLSREKQSKADSQELAKSVGQQLKKITFKTSERIDPIKNITLGFLQYGVGGTLGNRFTRGVEQGTGINSRFLGKQIGKAARYPLVLANEFKKGFFDEDNQVKFKDKEDPDENTGNSSSSPPKKPSGGSGGTNSKTFGNNLLEKFIYQEGQKLSNKVDRKNSVHALIDAWATWSKEKNLRFAIPQFIEKMRQKSDKESFGDKEINEALEKRKDFLKEEIAKEEKLPDNQKIKINETRQKKQLLSPKEQLAYIEFLEKDRKDLYKKLGKLLFRFRGQNKLKFEELMAIYYYTESQGYKEMNQVLREQSKPLAEDLNIKEENLISSADKNIKVATSGLNRLPGFKGKTYRGLDFASIGIDPNEHYKVGQIIEEKGFTSTTKNQTMRYPGNVVWEINAKKGGKDISEIEAFTNEEVLFPPNSKFKVTGKRHVKKFGRDFWVIELDDVNEETADLPNVQNDFEKKQSQALTDEVSSSSPQASNSNVKTPQPQPQRKTRKKQNANISNVKLQVKPNDTNQIPIKQDTSGRPDGSRNQSPDRNPDIIPVGPVELPIGPRDTVAIEADSTRGGGIVPLAGRLDTYQKTLKESLAGVLEAQKAQTEIEIEPGFWVDVEQLNQGFVNKTQRRLILFWEKLRVNLGKEINRTLAGLLGTIPGAVIGRGLTGDPAGGFLGGMAGRLIAETGFQDVSNFRSLQQQGLSPATAEFWQQFGQNRKSLSNTLRKTAVGYVTGSVVGRGIGDVMQATGANRVIGALMPSWLEDAIGDGVNRTIKTIADPNIDLAIPHLPPVANRILSAPLHAVGNSVAAQGFLGNMGLSFLDNQAKTALMPVREALTGAGQAIGGDGFFGEYLGNRFTGIGIEAIQDTAKASGRGVAGMIAPGLPAEVRNFIADQVIKQGVLDGTVRDQVAPFLASRAGTDVFARGIKVPITGKVAGGVNKFLDKYDPYAIAPQPPLTDEQILLNREQRLTKKRTTAINAIENLFNRIDKSVDETTKAVVGIGNGFLGFFDNIRSKTYDFAKQTAGLADNPVTLVDQYAVYLDKLIQDAQKQAEETIKGIIPDYKKLTIPERKEAIGSYKEKVATEVKKFRMAIEDGESQIALEIGENILALVQSTRKVYKDLLEAVPSDLSGTKSIQANQRYLTNVQTEVLKGQPNLKGRAKTGLMQLVGTETSEGFIKGIEDKLTQVRNSGEELAESAIEGAKKRLGIASPSKEFEKLGESSGEGFQIGIEKSLQDARSAIAQKIEKILNTDFYHGTSKAAAKSIRQQGIDVDRVQDATYGKGFYLTDKLGEAESYANEHRRPAVLKARLNVKNPFIVTEKGYQNFIKHAQKRGELPDPFAEPDPTGEKYEQYHRDKTKLLQKKGYDSVFVRDKGFAVAFEAEQVKLEESGKNAIESMIASIKKLFGKLFGLGEKSGQATTEGFVQGMQGDQSEAINAIGDLVDSVIEKAKDDLEIQSPSRKFRKMGQQSSAGFAEGLEDGKEDVKESVGSFWNTLENVPILGWFIKFGKLFAKLVADLFNSKSQPKKSPKKQDKVKVDQEAVQEILNMDFYHGTSKAGEKSILEKGVDVNRVQDAVYGKGFYLANKREEAESYSNDHKNPAVLKAKIKVKNPFIVTEEEYQEFIKNAQKKGELIDPFAEPDPTGEKYEQYHKDKTKLLQKKGYDSIFIKDKGFAVIFQAQQVEFEKATKKASKEITNNFYTRYIAYLDNLKAASKKHAMQKIASDDYRALSQQDKLKVGKQSFTEIKEQFKEFKEAVTVGNKELAAEVGEQLVIASETLKTIYDDLLQDLNSDDKLFKEIEKQKTALERLERTTIGGKANQKGLANIALETNRSLEIGESVGDGFVQGIESKIEEAGIVAETLSEQVIKEAEKRLGIQSPSRVFEEIGQRVVEGFNLGVQAIQSAIHTPIDQALTAVDNRFSVFIGNAQQGFNNFIQKLEQDFPIFAELKDVVLGLAAAFALNNVLEFLAGQIVALGDASFGAVLELESMRLAFTSVTGSAEAGAKGLAFVRKEAQRLGVELKTAEEAYAGFLAVTRYTALQGNQADRIFSVFQETAARRGLSNEEQGRMFAAINQAISKRKLSAEEVRGQLGEIPGLAFESTVARSMGVNPAQLSEMMGDGLLMAEDVFPRVAALYEAENAKIAESSETTSQALTRFQNAIVNLQRSFEGWIAPAKTFFNFFAAAIEKISEIIPIVVRYLGIFSAALLIDFATISIELGKFLGSLKSVQAVLSVLARIAVASFKLIYKELLIFLKQFALMTLAFDAVGAAIYVLSNNAFPELKKGIEEATTRANQLEQALQNVGKATQAIPTKLPKTEEEIVTNRTWNILGWDTGFNLEGTRQFLNNVDKAFGFKPTLTTLGQQELANFQENVGGVLSQVDRNLSKEFDVEKTIKEIRELDKELTKARSRQFNIPAGDKKRYEAAIKEQQKLLEERDKKLDVTANFEKALQGDKAEIEKYLKTLNELVAKKGITSEAEKAIRAQLEQRLKDIDKTSTAFDGLMSNLQRSVNALTSALRNLNEQAAYFNETLERNATNARVQFIRRAQASGVGSQITDLGLEQIDRNTLKSRVAFLRDQLSAVNNELSRPDFAALLTELRQQAEDAGINLENTATIDRLINENRSQQETAVLNALKEQLRLKDELGQTEENLERSIGSARSAIRDMNQSVEDFFFNLTQQIEEALVETQRILNKLKYTDIKNKLQRALVPGSDTFVNGLIGQIQGIFDQASGILEQVLGQRSAQINFAGERRGLQYELENFTRNLGGATEALELFRQGLLGGSGSGSPVASGRFAIGTVGATGVGTGAHLDIRGKDRQGNRLSESRLRELLSLVVVGGKPLSEQLEKITSGYGHRRPPTRGASSFHPALDFGFSRGTSIEFTGQAVSARTFFDKNGGGNVVEITLPNGEKLQLLHLDSVANLGTIQNARVNVPGNTPGNTPRRRMPNVPFASLIESAARQAGIDPLLFAALVRKESGFRQEEKPGQILTSSAGAVGISQLKRDTARELGVNPDKVAENLIGGAKYLAKMLKRFGGNIQLALSAYKAGPGNIRNGQVMAPGTVKDVAIVMQYYREFQQQMAKSGAGQVAPPANQPSAFAITSPTPPDNSRAQELTNRLINQKDRLINLGDAGIRQEIEAFLIELRQTQTTILRQMSDSIRTSRQSVIDAQNSLLDARSQYSPQTQSAQLESELRGVENQFLQLDSQLFEQERGLSDNIQGLDNLLNQMKAVLVILHQSNNQVDKESASFLMGLIGQIEQDKAGYSGMLTQIQSLRGELKQGKVDAQNFVQAQAKLRTIQADLERIGTELNIAQQQNNIEQEKAIALLQSRQQLELDLLQISQDYEGEDKDKRLANAKEEARLREREIEYQFQSKKLNQETELIGQRLAIAQSLSNLGKRNELELLQSQKQLEQEILDIKKQYPDLAEQELRINLAREQARLREIGIENTYRNDRWQREQELLDMDNQIAEAQAERLEAAGDVFGAANLREQAAFAAELLRYEQEIEAIRQRYPDDPQRADELIRKATILQGLNLEKIDRQFKDLGETIRDIGVGAFSTFLEETLTGTKSIGDAFLDMAKSILQSLAQIAARMAISGLFRWMNIPGFSEGGTVPNYADGDTVKSAKVANLPFKRIQEALRKEGTRGVLAVFTPGEEILSLRTGEAQRYQALKMQLGKNPLAKIGNFADGGTIADNLLAGLPNNNMSARLPNGFGQNITNNNYRQGERSVTVNVTAPDPSAFKASERQIARIMSEYLSRV